MFADTSIRQAIFEFLKRLSDYAKIRMITIVLLNNTVAEYTGSLDVLFGAINKFSLSDEGFDVAEGAPRSPITTHTRSSGRRSSSWRCRARPDVDPRTVPTRCGRARIMVSATLASGNDAGPVQRSPIKSGREEVRRRPEQSGGRRIEVSSTGAFPCTMQQSPTISARRTRSPTCRPTASSRTSACYQQQAQGDHAACADGDS